MSRRIHGWLRKKPNGVGYPSGRLSSIQTLEARMVLTSSLGLEPEQAIVASHNQQASQSVPLEAAIPNAVFAPYVDTTLWPPFDFVEYAQNEGIKHVTLAFVVAEPGTGKPSWGGYYSVESGYRGDQIEALRALGGEVMVSFGGAAGTPLAAAIKDVDQLTQAYRDVIDQYDLTWIDFDVEGSWVADRESIERRSQAIYNLQQQPRDEGRPLEVWYTLPVLPSGLTADGLAVIDSALKHGVEIGGVNIMAMDYGDGAAPNPEGRMGDYAIEAAQSLFEQMKTAWNAHGIAIEDADLWERIGVTPMIGQNDVLSERFYLEDAAKLLNFADEVGMGMLSAWSVNRDSACETVGVLALHCSGVPQDEFEFSEVFAAFTSETVLGPDLPLDDGSQDSTGSDLPPENEPPSNETPPPDSTDDGSQSDLGEPSLDGQVFRVNPADPDILDFDPAKDQLDFGDLSVHGLIVGKLPSNEIAIVNPWSSASEYQVVKDRTFRDLDLENYGIVANEHLRQDLGGVISWEQGIGPREEGTIYIRSHEYGVSERIENFDPNINKISFLYFGTRERLSVEDTNEGLLISVQPTNQSVLIAGVSKSDLIPTNIEFHHDQIVEDQLEVPFGFTVEQLTLVSRAELLTPLAPAGEVTDGTQTRPGSQNQQPHGQHGPGENHGGESGDGNNDGSDGGDHMQDIAPAFSYRTTDDWGSGFNGEITLTNQSDLAWSGWELEFDWTHQVNQAWNGILASQDAGRVTITNEFWNGTVQPGQSVTIGISGSTGDVTTAPTDVSINGMRVGSSPDEHDEPAAATLAVGNIIVDEGDTVPTVANFVVTLSEAVDQDVSVDYYTRDGSAVAGRDYDETVGTLVIPAGKLSGTISVTILGDQVQEASENFSLLLTQPVGANLSIDTGTATIRDNDEPQSSTRFEYRTVNDWGSGFTGEIKLTNESDQAWDGWLVEFQWEHDLEQIWSGSFVSQDGDRYVVQNVSWNSRVEPGQSVTFGFSGNPGNVTSSPTLIAINGDAPPVIDPISVSISDSQVTEAADGTSTLVFNVVLSRPATDNQIISVDFETHSISATAEEDYRSASGTVDFLPGEIEKTIEILVIDDAVTEDRETLEVTLSNARHAELGDATAIGVIVDNDASMEAAPVQWNVSSQWETGYVAQLRITNDSDSIWEDWELEFESPHQLSSIWGAEIIRREGNRYVIRPLAWNSFVGIGNSLTIGYQVNSAGPLEPTDLKLRTST